MNKREDDLARAQAQITAWQEEMARKYSKTHEDVFKSLLEILEELKRIAERDRR